MGFNSIKTITMKKTIFFTTSLIWFSNFCFSQDVIFKKDGSKVEAKIIEIGTLELKYKKISNIDGPSYAILKSDVLLVNYQNGTVEIFNNGGSQSPVAANSKKDSSVALFASTLGKNIISFDMAAILFSTITVSYERVSSKYNLGFRIPISYTMNQKNGQFIGSYYDEYFPKRSNIFNTGLDVNFYPAGQGKLKYVVGPSIKVGLLRYYEFIYDYYLYPSYYGYKAKQDPYYFVSLKNGMVMQPSKSFYMSANIYLGYVRTDVNYVNTSLHADFDISMGVRF